MSYILDALRRADAERRRGQSPALADVAGLASASAGDPRPAAPWRRLLPWAAATVLTLAAGLVWWLTRPGPATAPGPGPAVSAAPGVSTGPSSSPLGGALPGTAPPNSSGASPAVPAAPSAPPLARAIAPPPPALRPSPRLSPAQPLPQAPTLSPPLRTAPAGPGTAPAARVAPGPAAVPARPGAPPGGAAPVRPIPVASLPEPQRSAVARLSFGGAVHSADRRQSFVMLAGQIVREGETLAPGIVLEQIGPRQLLLRVGEQQVEVPL